MRRIRVVAPAGRFKDQDQPKVQFELDLAPDDKVLAVHSESPELRTAVEEAVAAGLH